MKPLPLKPIITLLLITICSQLFAQTDPITRNAVFLSFEEFKNNTPSIHPINIFLEQTGEDKFELKYQDSTGKIQEYKKDIWGFSDSNEVYVKYNKHYAKFMAIGKVCVFKFFHESETKWSYVATPNGSMGLLRHKTKEKEESYKSQCR